MNDEDVTLDLPHNYVNDWPTKFEMVTTKVVGNYLVLETSAGIRIRVGIVALIWLNCVNISLYRSVLYLHT